MRTFIVIIGENPEEIELSDSDTVFSIGDIVFMNEQGKQRRVFHVNGIETYLERSGKNADIYKKFFLRQV